MTDIIDNLVRYKQSKRKPMRNFLITLASSLIMLMIVVLAQIVPAVEDASDVEMPFGLIAGIIVAAAVVFSLIVLAVSYAIWRSDGFCIHPDGISYDFTFVIKRDIKLPFDKINSVKIKRNPFDMMLGLSSVKIGSGSGVTSAAAEMTLTFKKDYAEYFVDYLQRLSKAKKEGTSFDEEFTPPSDHANVAVNNNDYDFDRVKNSDKLRSIFTSDALLAIIIAPIFTILIAFFTMKYAPDISVDERANKMISILSGLGMLVITVGGTIAGVFIRYYDFKIYEKDGCIHISHGLITQTSHSISKDKIRGYTLRQGLVQQLFRVGSLRLNVIGISEAGAQNQQVVTYLYPCAKLEKLYELIKKYIPEHSYEGETTRAGKNALTHNFLIPAFWVALIISVLSVPACLLYMPILAVIPLGLIALIVLLMLADAVLVKKNTQMGLSEKHLYASCGGMARKEYVIRMDSVQDIISYAGCIRQKQGICSYKIVFRGDNMLIGSTFLVRNLPLVNLEKLN